MENPQAELLAENYSLSQLRKMYRDLYGVASKSKNKKKLANDIAIKLAEEESMDHDNESESMGEALDGATEGLTEPEGSEPEDIVPAGMQDDDAEVMATRILSRISEAFDALDGLKKARRTEIGAWREKMGKAKDSIQTTIQNDDLDAKAKLERIESFWHIYQEAESRRATVAKEYTERIRAASNSVRSELDNAKQLPLF